MFLSAVVCMVSQPVLVIEQGMGHGAGVCSCEGLLQQPAFMRCQPLHVLCRPS